MVKTARRHDGKPQTEQRKKVEISVRYYRIPESLSALLSMVSFTAAKTNRMFDVSVACVRLGDHGQRMDDGDSFPAATLTEGKDSDALG